MGFKGSLWSWGIPIGCGNPCRDPYGVGGVPIGFKGFLWVRRFLQDLRDPYGVWRSLSGVGIPVGFRGSQWGLGIPIGFEAHYRI